MNDKEKSLSNRSLVRRVVIDERDRMINQFTSSINEQPTTDLFTQSIYSSTIVPISTTVTNKGRKRLITEECPIEESNKRIRNETMKKIQSENQPPRATIKRRSLFLYHPKHDWNYFPIENQSSSQPSTSPFNPLSLSSSSASSFTPSQSFNQQYSSSSSSCDFHSIHYSPIFNNESSMTMMKTNHLRIYPTTTTTTADGSSPLRTTNFVLDSKQQNMNATIMRTGNISPAHSDTSIESSSTCSSDEAHFHSNFSNFHSQPSRSFRERENYEQLLDLAEKLADPDRLEKIDMEQFSSYRYKSTIASNDIFTCKQTACVICMSPFKSGQRIRVLPCQHEYHCKCIARWFTMNSSCPICRRESFLLT